MVEVVIDFDSQATAGKEKMLTTWKISSLRTVMCLNMAVIEEQRAKLTHKLFSLTLFQPLSQSVEKTSVINILVSHVQKLESTACK